MLVRCLRRQNHLKARLQDSSASFASLDLESELEKLKNDDKILEDVRNELHAAIDKSLDSVERLACSEQVPEEEDCFKRCMAVAVRHS